MRVKSNRWEVYGYSRLLHKFSGLAYTKTKREAEELLALWRRQGFSQPATVQKRGQR